MIFTGLNRHLVVMYCPDKGVEKMYKQFGVYVGIIDRRTKLATFKTIGQAEEFIATVVKAINVNNTYIQKMKQTETCYWYDYGEKTKFLVMIDKV